MRLLQEGRTMNRITALLLLGCFAIVVIGCDNERKSAGFAKAGGADEGLAPKSGEPMDMMKGSFDKAPAGDRVLAPMGERTGAESVAPAAKPADPAKPTPAVADAI